ncbi:energy transducer TonB [Chryseobacterium sp. MMS23-Vi53]|uniref:energy transducer TonB n=1 Tax=Chryseobacterium sp. MMS23-Vi53 TaxID=3386644 RepID=UPI0039E76A7E
MKPILFFLSLFFSTAIFAQEFSNVTQLPDYAILKTKMKLDDGVYTKADTPAEFPGGMETFKRKFAESMDVIDVKSNKIDTRVYFIVEKSGYVRFVAATGSDKKHSQAAEVAVRRLFVKWKPAMINGEPVRFLYTFPLSLKKY